jgi:hypothetical protein
MAAWSLASGVLLGAALALKSPIGGVALAAGSVCGILNAFLSMRGNERLLEHRSAAAFVLSSTLRIALFGIVPVEFALRGGSWAFGAYFVGFFVPLACYTVLVARSVRTG